MQWLHASYGIGVTLGPLIMTAGLNLFEDWHWVTGCGGRPTGIGCQLYGHPAPLAAQADRGEAKSQPERRLTDYKTSYRETLRQPLVWLSFLIFYLNTGAEATLGSWAYTLLTESRASRSKSPDSGPAAIGLPLPSVAFWPAFTTQRIGLNTLISGSLLGALAGSLLLWWNPVGIASLWG
jgi:hypothetical protein